MTHETMKSIDRIVRPSTLLMGAFLTAALVDTSWSKAERRHRDDQAGLISTRNDKDLSIIVLVGNGANGRQYAKQLGPHLEDFGSTHFVVYPENGFSKESVADRILEAGAMDEGKRKAIFVSSMGEMVFNHQVAEPEFANQLGDIEFLISNDGVTNLSNIQPRIKRMLHVGAHIPVTKSTASAFGAVRRSAAHKSIPHGPEISDDEAREHALSTASTPLYALSAQWRNMLSYDRLPDGALREFGNRVHHKIHLTAPKDRVINGNESYQDKVRLYGDFERIVDYDMPEGGHALAAEFPGSVRRILSRRAVNTVIAKPGSGNYGRELSAVA